MPRLGLALLLLLLCLALPAAAQAADTTGPNLTVISPTERQLYGANSTIKAAADAWDADSGVRYVDFKFDIKEPVRDDHAPFPTDRYEAESSVKDIPNGTPTVVITAVDYAGNATQKVITIITDKVAPNLTLTDGVKEGAWHAKGVVGINFTKGNDVESLQCALAKGTTSAATGGACTMGTYHEGLPSEDGPWTLTIRAFDKAGNAQTRARTFTVDATDPTVAADGGPGNPWVKKGTEVQVRPIGADANLDRVECLPPGGAWATCANSTWVPDANETEGLRKWQFRAVDKAGNTSTPAALSWISDGTGPAIAVSGLPAEGATVVPGDYTFDASATDTVSDVAVVECAWSVDGPFGGCPTGEQKLLEGDYTFAVSAADGAGNVSSLVRRFTVRKPAPPVIEDKPKSGGDAKPEPGPGTGTPAPAPIAGPGPAVTSSPRADLSAPVLTVTVAKTARGSVLRRGLPVTVGCSEACTGTATLTGPKGLKATARITRAGTLKLKVGAAALKKALRGRKPAKLTLTLSVRDAAGNTATKTATVTART